MREFDNIDLPNDCVLVKRDKPQERTASGLYLGDAEEASPTTGIIVKVGTNLILKGLDKTLLNVRIRFKEAFAESLDIDNEEYLFFRDLEPSIYYYFKNEKN